MATARKKKDETAIVAIPPQPQIVKEESPVQVIMRRIENVKLLHQFINKNLNVALKKRLKELRPGEKLTDKERTDLEIDYGTIPGSKPFLKQPGAEKILRWAYSRPTYETAVEALDSTGHLEVVSRVRLHATADGTEVFSGPMCSCSSMESNFRFRWLTRDFAEQADKSMRQSVPAQQEQDKLKRLGMGRWRKEWVKVEGRKEKVEQWVWQDRIENPNIYDERNNVRQRSEKRALVKCVRQFGALSEIFTTDPNDWDAEGEEGEPPVLDHEPQGRVVFDEDAPHGHPPGSPRAKQAEATLTRVEEADKDAVGATNAVPKSRVPKDEPKSSPRPVSDPSWPLLEAEAVSPREFQIFGYVPELFEVMEACCTVRDGFFYCSLEQIEKMQGMQEQHKFRVTVVPSRNPGAKGAPATKTNPAGSGSAGTVAEPELVSGTLEQVYAPPNTASPMRQVKILLANGKKPVFGCFNHKLFVELDKGKGAIEVYATKTVKGDKTFHNIVGLKRLGKKEWDRDGLPVIQNSDREAGQKTLY